MGRGRRQVVLRERSGNTFIPLGETRGRSRLQPEIEIDPELSGRKRLPEEWATDDGIIILDADGWRSGDLRFDEPCSYDEYRKRVMMCTQMSLEAAKSRGWVR